MPIITACCCWDTLKAGSRASAVFTLLTGIINVCIDIAILVTLHRLDRTMEPNEKHTFLMPGVLPFMYIELVCSIGLIIVSLLLLVGINRGLGGKNLLWSWVYASIGFRAYEIFLGVYILAWLGSFRVGDIVFVEPGLIVLIFYWVLDTILLVAALICVISYWHELYGEIYHKEQRIKYYNMLSNIRQAAGRSRSKAPSMHSFYAASRSTLAASQPSLAPSGASGRKY